MILIGLGHRARQGKDQVGKILEAEFGFDILHFADTLKEECAEYFGWSEDDKNVLAKDAITSDNWKKVVGGEAWEVVEDGICFTDEQYTIPYGGDQCPGIKFGQASLLQWWGTNFRRHQDNDYWVKRTINKIAKNGFRNTVVCDMRFPNEAAAIQMLNGTTVRLRRMTPSGQFITTDRDPNHPSEVALENFKFDLCVDVDDQDSFILPIAQAARNIYTFAKERL